MNTRTQCLTILTHLKSGKPITSSEAMRLYGIHRLAARIYDLKCEGEKVAGDWIEVETRDGDTTRVKRYRLEKVAA